MTTYLVSYDLRNEDSSHDYQPLWDAFAKLGAQKTQYSLYLVAVTSTARELHDHLKQYADKDDRLWVTEVVKNNYYCNAIGGTNAFLDKNPPAR